MLISHRVLVCVCVCALINNAPIHRRYYTHSHTQSMRLFGDVRCRTFSLARVRARRQIPKDRCERALLFAVDKLTPNVHFQRRGVGENPIQ